MKRLIVDLDGTLTVDADVDYGMKPPRADVINRLREFREDGYEIVLFSARGMRTYGGSVGKINVHTAPVILEWLQRHDVPFDELLVGKPWCGTDGFYVDDRAVRPSEFLKYSNQELQDLLADERLDK